MTIITAKNNHITPPKSLDHKTSDTSQKNQENSGGLTKTIPDSWDSNAPMQNHLFGTQKQNTIPQTHIDTDTDNIAKPQLRFFSSSEANLCSQIMKAIQKNHQTLFVSLPPYAQDTALANRIGDYIRLPNTKSVIINAQGLDAASIIGLCIQQLGLAEKENIYHEFAYLMTDYFHHGLVLHAVIYNADALSKQDFDYLYELASLIYEKFPKKRDKPLMRFIFVGDKIIAPILRKKTNSKFQQFSVSPLTITECVNALYLYTDTQARTALFHQTVGTNAAGLRIATAGYPALLRHLLPLPKAPSLQDKKNPEHYLSAIIDTITDTAYHKDINYKRMFLKQAHHFTRKRPYVRLLLGIIAAGLAFFAYYIA